MAIFAEIDVKDKTKIKLDSDWKYKELIAALPSSKYKDGKWYVNLSWQMMLALNADFGTDLTLGPELTRWYSETYHNTIMPAMNLREKLDAEGYESLYPHQRAGVAFLSTTGRAILADDMGVGKTRTAFSTVRRLYEMGKNPFPVLIACPNSTKYSWAREIEAVWPGLKVNVVDGTATKRRKLLEESAHVYIINWESLRSHSRLAPFGSTALKKCAECGGQDIAEVDGIPVKKISETACEVHIKELNKIDFGCVIGDEIHRVMDPSSKVARALKSATGKAEFRFGLSGTPIASAPDNLFSPLNWLMPEAYPSKGKYLDRMCLTTYNAWGATVVIGIKPERQQEFFAGIDPFLRRMPKEVILPFLPPIVRERRDVEMAAKQKKAYEQMRDQMVAELDGDLLITTSPLTKMTRMLQFSSSFAEIEYRPVRNKETKEVEDVPYVKLSDPSCKLDAFMDDLDDFGGESIVVFAVSSQLVRMLSARLEKAKIPHGLITGEQDAVERQHHMDQFQSGKTKLILCTIAAGGTGITLTTGSIAVFLQRSWSMIENLQAEARVHRIGSEQHDFVRIIDYVTAGSVEEAVFEAVEAKSQQLEFILRDKDLIKKTLKGNKE